jgi:putative ABC transport system permease protein
VEQTLRELRLALRSLGRARGFFVSSVLVLALAIGATSAVFGLVDALLLRALPFKDPDRLVMVWEKNAARPKVRNVAGPANFFAWKERSRSFLTLEAYYAGSESTLGGSDEPEHVSATLVTPGLLPALGVSPLLGRGFAASEGVRGNHHVVLLSKHLFERRFGGDASLIGKTVELDGEKHLVVGILPEGLPLVSAADILIPLPLDASARKPRGRWMTVIGRLAPAATLSGAQAEMEGIASALAKEWPEFDTGWSVNLVPLKEQLVGEVRPALLVLLGAVGLVLLIACTNVANLVLARTAARRHELGVRLALGASGRRLFAQLAAECFAVAVLGGAAGLLVARTLLDLAAASAPPAAKMLALPAHLSPRVVLFTLAAAFAAALATSLAAVLTVAGGDVVHLLKRGSAAPSHARMRSALVVAETAVSVLLLVGAGLFTRSVLELLAVDPGFAPERTVTLTLSLPRAAYSTSEKQIAFLEGAVERARRVPGVVAAGTVSTLPLDGPGAATSFKVRGLPEPAPGQKPVADVRAATGAYFEAMGIPVLQGRGLPESRVADGAPVPLVVNHSLARQLFPRGDALGSFLDVDMNNGIHGEIVGVAGDVRLAGLDTEPRSTIYWDARNSPMGSFSLAARVSGGEASAGASLLKELRALDPAVAVSVRSMEALVGASVSPQRSLAVLVAGFAIAALLLTAVGLYGVISYLVTQRTSEIGVRLALGAAPRHVAAFVLRGGAALVLGGAAVGLVAAMAAAPLLSRLLYGVAPRDTLTFAAVPALLVLVALLACAVPALRASRVDPMTALRAE